MYLWDCFLSLNCKDVTIKLWIHIYWWIIISVTDPVTFGGSSGIPYWAGHGSIEDTVQNPEPLDAVLCQSWKQFSPSGIDQVPASSHPWSSAGLDAWIISHQALITPWLSSVISHHSWSSYWFQHLFTMPEIVNSKVSHLTCASIWSLSLQL